MALGFIHGGEYGREALHLHFRGKATEKPLSLYCGMVTDFDVSDYDRFIFSDLGKDIKGM